MLGARKLDDTRSASLFTRGARALLLATAVGCIGGCTADGLEEETASSEDGLEDVDSASATSPIFSWRKGSGASADHARATNSLLSSCDVHIEALTAISVPVRFVDEGKPSTDPLKGESRIIWKALEETMPTVGYCALLDNPKQGAATRAIVSWGAKLARTYKGGVDKDSTVDDDNPGNPINERHIIPMILAWDMAWPRMTPAERTTATTFLSQLERRVASFMSKLSPGDDRRLNNWNMDALAIRTYATLVARNTTRASSLRGAFNAFVKDSYKADAGFRPSRCQNLAAVGGGAYGSFDLQQRDAFTYHMKGISTVLELAALRPAFFTVETKAVVDTAFRLTKPYVLGTKTHKEFVCTTVTYDLTNPKLGKPWEPTEEKVGFRFGRVVYPTHRPWLAQFNADDYAPWIKVFVSGKGDVIDYP